MQEESKTMKLTLFVSFDLTNSTLFKYYEPEWITLYYKVLEYLENGICNEFKWHFWKVNGDEILFYCNDFPKKGVDRIIVGIDKLMASCLDTIYKEYPIYANVKQLSLKATVWLAGIRSYDPENSGTMQGSDFQICLSGIKDFIGKEIDIGFRIGKFTPRSKTALSAALLYYLLKQNTRIVKRIRIVAHVKLKGVWHDKRYPIIWYIRSMSPRKMIRSFHYDEKYDNKCIDAFLKHLATDSTYGSIEEDEFKNMLEYLGIKEGYDKLFGILEAS